MRENLVVGAPFTVLRQLLRRQFPNSVLTVFVVHQRENPISRGPCPRLLRPSYTRENDKQFEASIPSDTFVVESYLRSYLDDGTFTVEIARWSHFFEWYS